MIGNYEEKERAFKVGGKIDHLRGAIEIGAGRIVTREAFFL